MGRASLGTGDIDAAKIHLDALRGIQNHPAIAELSMEFNASSDLLALAENVLSGWIATAEQDYDTAIVALETAVEIENELFYGEPPEWSVPVRQELGAVLLRAGRAEQAEQVFQEDLAKFPENGWSLYGLAAAQEAQGKNSEAMRTRADLETVWSTSDVDLDAIF